MFETIKHLTKHSVVYGLGGTLNKLIGFFLLPIYTRLLTPADYGILSLLTVTSSLATIIAHLGLGSAMFREEIYVGSDERLVESTTLCFLLGESAHLLWCDDCHLLETLHPDLWRGRLRHPLTPYVPG